MKVEPQDTPVKGKLDGLSALNRPSLGIPPTQNGDIDSQDESSGSERFMSRVKPRRSGRRHGNAATDDRQSTDDLRRVLYDRVAAGLKDGVNSADLKAKHQISTEQCLRDDSGPCPTILHWIVRTAEVRDDLSDKRFNASLELLSMALELDQDLLVERDKRDDTALHMALASEKWEPLVACMCDNATEDTMKRALDIINSKGETCVHLAVAGELDIASRLVKLADPDTLLRQRHAESTGKDLKGGGNTPLHDAVAYERCVIEEPKCRRKDGCNDCPDKEDQAWERHKRVLEVVELLVSKNPKALMVKNAADQSPYLYHLSTRKEPEKADTANERPEKQPHGRTLGMVLMDGASTSRNDDAPALLGNTHSGDPKLNIKPNSSKVSGPGYAGSEKPKVDQTAPGVGRPAATVVSQKPKDVSMPPPDLDNCGTVKSEKLADEVKEHLLEYSFLLGNFEMACKCFFGDRRGLRIDKDYKDPNFRPGYPLGSGEHSCYEDLLDPPQVMSQVDLIVPYTAPDEKTWDSLSTEEQKLKRQSLWDDDMDSLRRVFELIRKKNVEKILKLTVTDNFDRPCSDEVIEDCLRNFDIRYLDWRKYDLCIDVVLNAAPKVVELWLYSNSNNAVLRSWAASNGICYLKRITTLHLDAQKNLESYDNYTRKIKLFDDELKENVTAVRTKLLLRSNRDTLQIQLKYEKNKRKQTEQAEARLNEWMDITRGKREESIAGMNRGGRTNSKLQNKIKKYDRIIKDAESDMTNLREGDELSKQTIKMLEQMATNITAQIKQFDEDTEEARMQTLLVRSSKSASEVAEDASKTKQRGTNGGSILGLSSLSKMPIENIPQLFNTRGGHVAWKFHINLTIEDEPKEEEDEDLDTRLEESEDIDAPIQQHRWLKNMNEFLDKYVRISESPGSSSFRVKVALIDDGVDANLEQFKGCIHHKGWPYGEPTSTEYPFYHSATGHGTEMAKLIQMICPNVRLYVAKLGAWTGKERVGRLGEASTAENAREAVEWALKQDVHIISMSWSLVRKDGSDGSPSNAEQIRLLDEQIQEAARRGIIMYCAAADESYYGSNKELYPKKADTEHIKAVGSAMENGQPSNFVDASQVDYLFPGEEIKGLGDKKGSSAATAIASGLAALILWCFEQHQGSTGVKKIAHPKKMHYLFTKLKARESKWVDATKVFKEGNNIGNVVSYCGKVVDAMDMS